MDVIEIFKLYGSILVDSSKAEESISKTEKKAEGLGGKFTQGIATAGKWGAGLAAGAAVVGTAVGAVVMKAADAAGELDDTSKRIGMSAEEYQKYAYAAKLSGIESSKLEGAMKKQQKVFSEAKTGGKSASEAYQKLGIDISKVGTSGEAFDVVVKKLANMKDANERNVLANQIFGKSYADLLPMMADGADGIEAMKNEAVDMGAVMSNDSVSAGAKFGDTLDSVKMAFNGVVIQIGSEFLPYLQKMLNWIMAHMPEIKEAVRVAMKVVGAAFKTIGKVIEVLMPVFKGLYSVIKNVAKAFGWVADKIEDAYNWLTKWNKKDAKSKSVSVSKVYNPTQAASLKASGLAYVPYDGYLASLHKGERILSRGEVANQESASNITINITGNNISSDYDVDRIGERLAAKLQLDNRRMANRTSLLPIG